MSGTNLKPFFVFVTMWVYIPSKDLHIQAKVTLVSVWWEDGINPDNYLGIQRLFYLVIPTKHQYLTCITILVLVGWVLSYHYGYCVLISCIHVSTCNIGNDFASQM